MFIDKMFSFDSEFLLIKKCSLFMWFTVVDSEGSRGFDFLDPQAIYCNITCFKRE